MVEDTNKPLKYERNKLTHEHGKEHSKIDLILNPYHKIRETVQNITKD